LRPLVHGVAGLENPNVLGLPALLPFTTSNCTAWPSCRLRKPFPWMEEKCAKTSSPSRRFAQKEAAGSIMLLISTAVAIAWANSPWRHSYETPWHTPLTIGFGHFQISETRYQWINDGLMSIFFFLVGLEIKREVLIGELSRLKKAAFPFIAALGTGNIDKPSRCVSPPATGGVAVAATDWHLRFALEKKRPCTCAKPLLPGVLAWVKSPVYRTTMPTPTVKLFCVPLLLI